MTKQSLIAGEANPRSIVRVPHTPPKKPVLFKINKQPNEIENDDFNLEGSYPDMPLKSPAILSSVVSKELTTIIHMNITNPIKCLLKYHNTNSRLSSVVERVTFNPVAVGSIPTDGVPLFIFLNFCNHM